MDSGFKFEMGAKIADMFTDFKGTVIARVEWNDGTRSYAVQSWALHEGKRLDSEWVGEARMVADVLRVGPRVGVERTSAPIPP